MLKMFLSPRFSIVLRPVSANLHSRSLSGPKNPKHIFQHLCNEDDINKLRNIGIIAHINAGKTTTTERILFYSGSTKTIGDVDLGNTVTDYLVQERDRGITITSASVSFDWKKHRVNLIDTPGHVDFTFEVERSLSVLDGAVTILDSSAGVEAQTVSVWSQASKYNLPNIIFLNKCDKPQASIKMCMKDLKDQFEIKTNLIQLPIISSSQVKSSSHSIIDLVNRNLITWTNPERTNGTQFKVEPLEMIQSLDKESLDKVEEERERLINDLGDCDEELANHVISCDKFSDVSDGIITRALRRATIECKFSPVLVGSSFNYIGVQQLIDAIIDYLPSPLDRRKQILNLMCDTSLDPGTVSGDTCALIFKIMHDKRLGALNYVRVYSGSIARSQCLQNIETGKLEQVKKIYRAFGDELQVLEAPVGRDDIVILTGLTESKTGDVLISQNMDKTQEELKFSHEYENNDQSSTKSKFKSLSNRIILPKIEQLEPVYFCSIESETISQQMKLEQALACMVREDPSLSYDINSMGVTTIRGMGRLHLEVTRDRMESEYGVRSSLGPLMISYRETIQGFATEELNVNRLINSNNNSLFIKLYVRSKPGSGTWSNKKLRLDTNGENSLVRLRSDQRKAIETGLQSAMLHGPSLGYPVIDCDILLLDFRANHRCGLPVISSAASQCLSSALSRCSPLLLEPIMLLEAIIPKKHNGTVIGDITGTRRGLILSTQPKTNGFIVIRSKVPLSTLGDYSEFLRITTSGRGSFSIQLHSYDAMSETDKQNVTRL